MKTINWIISLFETRENIVFQSTDIYLYLYLYIYVYIDLYTTENRIIKQTTYSVKKA